MTHLPQHFVKILPEFSGKYLLPEDFKFSSVFNNLDFYSFNNPIFFPKLLEKIRRIKFSGDFLFSFINSEENKNYFIFTNQNYFVLIDLNIFSDIYDTINEVLIKQENSNFIPLDNEKDEDRIKNLFTSIPFQFSKISTEQKVLIDNLLNKLFPTKEIINFTIFTKVALEMFSALIILSNSNSSLNSILTVLNSDIEYEIGNFYESRNTPEDLNIAIDYYQRSSEKDHPDSILKIGYIKEKRGKIEEAINFYKKLNEKDNSEGQYRLSLLLLSNSKIDTKEIIDYLTKSAEKGNNTKSQILLGDIYNNTNPSRKIERNMAKSFNYYLMAAENGSKEAYKKLQKLYKEDKNEVIMDTSVEFRYLKLSADNNNSAEEQYQLGRIYEDDSITKKDIDKGIYYLEKASDQGHSEARVELALLFKKILKNDSEIDRQSLKILTKYPTNKLLRDKIIGLLSSISNDNIDAQYNLGLIYLEEDDIFQARIYFLRAAENGHAESQYQVGLLFTRSEEGKKKYMNRAINYLTEASNNGHSDADVKLGDIYSTKDTTNFDMKKAISFYEKGSNRGNTEAQIRLGNLYKENKDYDSMKKAIDYYRLACDNGNPTGLSELGRFYYNGFGNYIVQNYEDAYNYLLKAADKYDKYAQYYVGLMKYFGHGCIINVPEAIEWLIAASKQDNDSFTEAMLKLGLLYINELKPTNNQANFNQIEFNYGAEFINVDESVKWLSKASKKGNSEASNKLGKMYRKGRHVKKDINKAIEFYTDAADRNDQKAIYRLALIYYEGKATTTLDDIDKAVELLRILARNNHIKARIKLADIYTRPFPKVTTNEDIASDHISSSNKYDINNTSIYRSKYYTKENIAEAIQTLHEFYKADVNAKAKLGELLYKGIQVKQSVDLAVRNLIEASKCGNTDSLLFLGRIYYKGTNIQQNKDLAIQYLKQSAELKNVKAENKLGKIYFRDGDFNESLYWFTQAAQHGYSVAQYNLGLFYLENRGPKFPKRVQLGLQNLEVAATQNYLPALLKLGDFYYKGSYYNDEHFHYHSKVSMPNPNYLKVAITYYKRAADLKSIKAMIKLGQIYERGIDYNLLLNQKECNKTAISYYEKAYLLGFNLYEKNHPKMSKNELKMLYNDHSYVFPAVKLALFQQNKEKVSCMDNKKAIMILLDAQREGNNVAAINFCAKLYMYKNYTKSDLKSDAVNLFQRASNLGSKKANIHLGLYYLNKHEYQNSFNYFNKVLISIQNERQDPKNNFDVDFEYDLIEKDYDLYASFFCQLLAILSTKLSVDTCKWALNFNDQAQIAKYHHPNDINSDFYDGLFNFDDLDNDVMHYQYYNNNSFSLDNSIMYKSYMRDSLCQTNNFNNFYQKITQFIELFRHDNEFFELHINIINELSTISYNFGNSKTLIECAVLLDDNVVKNNVSNYDCFSHLYKIDLNKILSTNIDNFNHSEFAVSLYKFILEKIPYVNSPKSHQIAALNLSNYLTGIDKFRLIVPYAHNGVEFAIRKICEDFPSFTNILTNKAVKIEVSEDHDDDFDDFSFQCLYESIDFNKPDDRKKVKTKLNTLKVTIISDMKSI